MVENETEPADPQPSPTPPLSPLSLLLELQEHDLTLDRLAYRRRMLPARTAVADLTARLAKQADRVAETQKQHDELAARQLALDDRSEAVGARIATIEQRLSSGRAGSYRDEQAMGEEAAFARPPTSRHRGSGARRDGGARAPRPGARRDGGGDVLLRRGAGSCS